MHPSTTLSLSQTIWPRWASRHFLTLPIVQTLVLVTFGYSLSSEAVVMRQLRRRKRLWRRSLTCSHKRTPMGSFRSYWNGTTSRLQLEEITLKGTRVSCVCTINKSLETYLMILVSLIKLLGLCLFMGNSIICVTDVKLLIVGFFIRILNALVYYNLCGMFILLFIVSYNFNSVWEYYLFQF